MNADVDRITRRRQAQNQAQAFFGATDGIIDVSKGTDAITLNACKDFVQAVHTMFLRDHNIDLREKNLEDSTFLVFSYLQSQTMNDYIEPNMAFAYGQALALSIMKLGLHKEQAHKGYRLVITGFQPIFK